MERRVRPALQTWKGNNYDSTWKISSDNSDPGRGRLRRCIAGGTRSRPRASRRTSSVDVAKVKEEIANAKAPSRRTSPAAAGRHQCGHAGRALRHSRRERRQRLREGHEGRQADRRSSPSTSGRAGRRSSWPTTAWSRTTRASSAKKYGFYVQLAIVDDPVKARDLFASGQSHILWGTLDMIALFAPELVKDSRTVPVVCQQIDWSGGRRRHRGPRRHPQHQRFPDARTASARRWCWPRTRPAIT